MTRCTPLLAALVLGLIAFVGGWPSDVRAQDPGAYPAVPCEDPAADLASRFLKTCKCDEVPRGECAYDSEERACLDDLLVCRKDSCNGLFDHTSVSARCGGVASDQKHIPNILLVVSDDANWAMFEDIRNQRTGERYSLWDEYFQNRACHGGPDAGMACAQSPECAVPGRCMSWTRRCVGGPLKGTPCKDATDCGGDGATCERCPRGACKTNPMRTPNLDSLAESGAFFPVAHTTASVCAPSLMSMLTGQRRKDFEPITLPIVNVTLPRVLSDTHCSVSVGKTWVNNYDQTRRCYDCCCEAAGCCDDVASCPSSCTPDKCCGDPETGFDFSIQIDYSDVRNFNVIGRRKRTLERGACLMRQINQEGKAFFTWFMPYVPHDPKGSPPALRNCYDGGLRDERLRVDGIQGRLPVQDYLGRLSWMDCMLGTYLDLLENTPDTRFCPEPTNAAGAGERNCGPCARPCDEGSPCSDGVECVEGRCASNLPCLIDTTVILYLNDNGETLGASKGNFTENGYRTPMIVSYGGLGAYEGDALASMPARIEPEIYTGEMSHALDIFPTLVDYAGVGDPCLTSCSPECETCGACRFGDLSDPRCNPYPGRSMRTLFEGGSDEPWRTYLFGFRNLVNRPLFGDNAHYLRSERMVGRDVPRTLGNGQCHSNQDCAAQGWAASRFGLNQCVNGICTRACETKADCGISGLNRAVDCMNGFCETASACKLYHFPETCSAQLYNLTRDAGENRDLLSVVAKKRNAVDPLRVCYNDNPGTRGHQLYEEMSCELVRWCLDLCSKDPDLPCSECCAAELCNECQPAECSECLATGECAEIRPGVCVECGDAVSEW